MSRGFTLLELLVVFALVVTMLALGIPALNNFIVRSKTEGFARETSVLLQRARLEAIKQNRDAAVYLDTVNGGFAAFLDTDLDGAFDPSAGPPPDYEIGRLPLPSGVSFQDPAGNLGAAAVDGLSTIDTDWANGLPAVIFQPNGSVDATGAFRIGDERENFLEIRVQPQGTGKVAVLMYQTRDGQTKFFPAGDFSDPDYQPWEWK